MNKIDHSYFKNNTGNGIIFTGMEKKSKKLFRYAGPYRFRTELEALGWSVEIIDYVTYFTVDEVISLLKDRLKKEIKFVGFSLTFLNSNYMNSFTNNKAENNTCIGFSKQDTEKLINFIKNNNIYIMLGGSYSSKIDIYYDLCLFGANEKTINPNFSFNKSIIKWKKNDFLPDNVSLPIEIARGCAFKCKNCSYSLNGKKSSDYIKDSNIIFNEMMNNYHNFKTDTYFFCDDCYNDSLEKMKKMKVVFKKLPFKLRFFAYLRIDILLSNKNMIDDLYSQGLRSAFIGIESFNHKSASLLGKKAYPDDIKNMLLYIRKTYPDLLLVCAFIAGLPYESLESFKDGIDWCHNIGIKINAETLRLIGELGETHEQYGYKKIENEWINDLTSSKECDEFLQNYIYNGEYTLGSMTLYNDMITCGIPFNIISDGYNDKKNFINKIILAKYDKKFEEIINEYKNKKIKNI